MSYTVPNLIDTLTREYLESNIINPSPISINREPKIGTSCIGNHDIGVNNIVNMNTSNSIKIPASHPVITAAPMTSAPTVVASAPMNLVAIAPFAAASAIPQAMSKPPIVIQPLETQIAATQPAVSNLAGGSIGKDGGDGGLFSWFSISNRAMSDLMWIFGCILFIIVILYLRCKFVERYDDEDMNDRSIY